MGNILSTIVRFLACCAVALVSVTAYAQNTTIGSQAGLQVGSSNDPECKATIYSADNCGPCQALKAKIQNNPDQYGCNSINFVSCGARYQSPTNQECIRLGISSFPTTHGNLCDCRAKKPTPLPTYQPPVGDPKNPPPYTPPANPPSSGINCTGQAKIKCPAGNSWACCLYACDSSQASGCLTCPSYQPCGRNSCTADKTCLNKSDEKGCPQNFTCESKTSDPGDDSGGMVCDLITGVCRPRNPLIDDPLMPEPPLPEPSKQPDPPKPKEPTVAPTAAPTVTPPSGVQCGNPCPSQNNRNNCCGPTQGCYQGTCSNYSGCTGCKAGQICSTIDRAPWYGCKDKSSPPSPEASGA